MPQILLNASLARNVLFLAVAAAGVGWLFYSRAYVPAGRAAAGFIERAKGESSPPRIVPSKIGAFEPMAGYGA